MKLFLKECEENGTVDILPIKCILTGLPRVGKTSFLKRIEKKMSPFHGTRGSSRQVIPSTGLEAPVTVNICEEAMTITNASISKGRWQATSDLHEQGNILLSQVKHHGNTRQNLPNSEKTRKTADYSPPSTNESHKNTNSLPYHNSNSPMPNPYSSSNQPLSNPVNLTDKLPQTNSMGFLNKFTKMLTGQNLRSARDLIDRAVLRNIDVFENADRLTTIYFLDTGGQPEFHELLPPLLHGSAFHLIFFNAFQSLFKAVEVEYRHQDNDVSSIKYETSSSSIEIIHQLLVSFFSISRKEKHESVAALFGSYIDQFSSDPEECSKQLLDVSHSLHEYFSDTSFYQQEFLALPSKEECPYIFHPIDNMTCSEVELEGIQQFIYSVVKKRFSPVSLPITWAIFHLTLRDKYEKLSGVCSMQECISLADECNIPNEHVTHVLEYLHSNLGTVLYYDKVNSLSDYIIVNPNVLFSSISRFVTLSFMGSGEHHNTACSVRQTGEIPARIMQLNVPLSENCPLTNQHVVDLLVHFKLLHVSSDLSTYFMPCLLLPDPTVVTSLVSLDVLSIAPPPLLILFEEGFVPIGLFSGLINEISNKWENIDKSSRFRNKVKFIIPPGYVELRHCLKYIEVRAVNMEPHCPRINDETFECLENVLKVQPHLEEAKCMTGFYCPGSLSNDHPHTCKYSCTFDKALICTKNPRCFDSRPLPPQYILWFKVSKLIHVYSELYNCVGCNYCVFCSRQCQIYQMNVL